MYKKQNSNIVVIKIPPHSREAEQAVLGGIMLDNDSWNLVSDRLTSKDFYIPEHGIIFDAISELINKDKPCDIITISDLLKQKNKLEKAGGESYLFMLEKNTPTSANIVAYADIVIDRSTLRKIAEASSEIENTTYSTDGLSSDQILENAEQSISSINAKRGSRSKSTKNISEIMEETLENIQIRYENKDTLIGLSTGFKDLDDKTLGLQKGDLIIVAARPSMGKTSFAMNIAEHIALEQYKNNSKKAVLVFSMEMPSESLVLRMISSLGKIDQQKLRTGRLTEEDFSNVTRISTLLSQSNLLIDDTCGLSPVEIRARARRVIKEYKEGLALIVVDYLQLMQAPGYGENRTIEVSAISRSLKALAKELQVPLIAISQLNRNLEQRQNKRPVMADIRESGSIEQDADLILFIYRDEIHNDNTDNKNIAEIIIGKHRNGPIGISKLRFDGHYTRFDNLDFNHYNINKT